MMSRNVVTAAVEWPDNQVTTQGGLWFSLYLFHNKGHLLVVTQLFSKTAKWSIFFIMQLKSFHCKLSFIWISMPMCYELWRCSTYRQRLSKGETIKVSTQRHLWFSLRVCFITEVKLIGVSIIQAIPHHPANCHVVQWYLRYIRGFPLTTL